LCRIDGVVAGVLHPEPEAHLHVIGGEIGGVIDVDVDEVFDGATGDDARVGDSACGNRQGQWGFKLPIEYNRDGGAGIGPWLERVGGICIREVRETDAAEHLLDGALYARTGGILVDTFLGHPMRLEEGRQDAAEQEGEHAEGCRPSAPLTPAQLADQSGVTRATMTGLIDTLERDGLVLREPSKEDRRMMQVALTRKGEALLKDFLPVHFRRIAALMGALTQDEQKLMVQLTQKIVARTREVQSAMAEGNA